MCVRRVELLCPSKCAILPKSPSVQPLGNSLKLSFWVSMEASLHRYDGVFHWPMAIELNSQPACLLFQVRGTVGLKIPIL